MSEILKRYWITFWMRRAGVIFRGRLAARFATWAAPPHKARTFLARITAKGYLAPSADIYHPGLRLGSNVYIGDRVTIFRADRGGPVLLGDRVSILRDTINETGEDGSLEMGADTYIHPRCQFNAYKASIRIGAGVLIAANCAMYPHNHGMLPDRPIREQPLQTKGDIVIGDHAWLGTGVIVPGGVRIGNGAALLALPSTLEFVLRKANERRDPIPAAYVRAIQAIERDGRPGDRVLQRPVARYPPLPVVLAGRRVLYERFTVYLTQFASPAELRRRHEMLFRFFRTTDRDEAREIARSLGATHLCLYGSDRVRFDGRGALTPLHEENGARSYRLEWAAAASATSGAAAPGVRT